MDSVTGRQESYTEQKRRGRPSKGTPRAFAALRIAVEDGATLCQAARAAGVHVSTVYRWEQQDPDLYRDRLRAQRSGRRLKHRPSGRKPSVRWGRVCPVCGAPIEVATALGLLPFWRCVRWDRGCGFASWRPLAQDRCPACRGPLYWSHSRLSIGCDVCGLRWFGE